MDPSDVQPNGDDLGQQRFAFAFAFELRYRPLLATMGVLPSNSVVELGDGVLRARFGRWVCESPLANITCVQVGGPYMAVKAIGVRVSFSDSGLTFGSTTAGGVCVCFREPVPGFDPAGRMRHPGLTMTVADREGFAAAVRSAAGLTGTDPAAEPVVPGPQDPA